ncbi:MAG: 4Fe-4S double cluster binding domain-containing protein [Smithellaceae bacterium]|nr:epoxyqueuosine reductase [Syntrophaceae bacterium]MDD4240861.1 4Fe-4S double cluster binding domain-containing protein [Smithellaceae bacterium]NLX53380.1 epoxyqueuosine reductase [Deltaproteobacteria bacterium]
MQNELMNILPNTDDYVIGFADLEDLVRQRYPYRYAVVIGKKLDDAVIDNIEQGPTPVYYDLYRATNDELNLISAKMRRFLLQNGIPCREIKATVQEDDRPADFARTLRMPFSHKMAATRAGLGWIGKTDLLVSERFGPRLRLATLLTNHRFAELGVPITESRCGACAICLEACPAGAANGRLWNDATDRDEFYDAGKCRDACRRLSQEKLTREVYLCGICVSVCPWGRRRRP